MEAPFRYPITGLADVQRLLGVLAASPQLVPGSLRLAEGRELLAEQLAAEGRSDVLAQPGDYRALLAALWQRPLAAQRPRWLRFNARLAAHPAVECSLRIDVPTNGDRPRWVDLEGSRDPTVLTRLRAVYAALGREAGLLLVEV